MFLGVGVDEGALIGFLGFRIPALQTSECWVFHLGSLHAFGAPVFGALALGDLPSSGASKWQPLNGSRRMVRKSAKTDGQKQSEKTDSPKSAITSEKVQKRLKTSENRRKSAKIIGMLSGDRFFWHAFPVAI